MRARPLFVDPHVHLWDLAHVRYPWLAPPFSDDGPNGSVESIATDYLLDDYLADAAGWDVRGIVHIDAGAHPADALKETAWLQAMADERVMPNGIIAFAALESPDLEAALVQQAAHANVRGIRQIVNWHPDPRRTYTSRDLTTDEEWIRGVSLLGKFELSFDLQCYPAQLPRMAGIVERHPGIRFIINHMGMPVLGNPNGLAEWRAGLRLMAALPQVAMKISGMGFAWRPWSIDRARPLIREVIDMFGAARCMFASNVPTDKLFGRFGTTLEAYADIVDDFSADEVRDLFGRNANRIYRLGLEV